jgi:CO dehydrogenase/acetyl-CoA synthase delta subunit
MKIQRPRNEVERLQIYFDNLASQIPNPTKAELEHVASRPCKWAKILEEKNKNPNGSREREVHETGSPGEN